MIYFLSRTDAAQHVLGEVSEWFKELVLKTSDAKAPRVRISASPPLLFKSEYLLEVNCPFGGR